MPETYTPTPAAPPATWTLPNNTELADAETFKNNVLKKEADNLAYFEQKRALFASSFAAYRNQRPSIQIVGTSVVMGTFSAYFPGAGAILTYAGASYSLGALAGNTWYYIYATQAAGVITLSPSATTPDATLQHQAGNADAIYVACFRTSGGGTPLTVRSVGGRYLYESQQQVLFSGHNATYTTVSISNLVPPHARSVRLWASVFENTAASNVLRIRPKYSVGSSTSDGAIVVIVDLIGSSNAIESEMGIEQGQGIEYKVDTDNATTSANIFVTGFGEAT